MAQSKQPKAGTREAPATFGDVGPDPLEVGYVGVEVDQTPNRDYAAPSGSPSRKSKVSDDG